MGCDTDSMLLTEFDKRLTLKVRMGLKLIDSRLHFGIGKAISCNEDVRVAANDCNTVRISMYIYVKENQWQQKHFLQSKVDTEIFPKQPRKVSQICWRTETGSQQFSFPFAWKTNLSPWSLQADTNSSCFNPKTHLPKWTAIHILLFGIQEQENKG